MTRSPTRDGLARRIEDLEESQHADLPAAGLVTVFEALDADASAEWVDRERQVVRIDGEHYHVPDPILGVLSP